MTALPSAFAPRLIAWQRASGRHGLPWQGTRDPYRVWLSEIMLQQTQVSTVLGYYPRFLERFPDVAALILAFSTTTPSTIGTPILKPVASMHLTHALNTCHLITHHVTWHPST